MRSENNINHKQDACFIKIEDTFCLNWCPYRTPFDILLIPDRPIRSSLAQLQADRLEKSARQSTSTLGTPATQLCHLPETG